MDELTLTLIAALLNGLALAVGMILGTRLTAKSMRKELENWIEESGTFQSIKKVVTDQTLIEKATKFFEEATTLVSSPEAKNFFANVTELMKQLSGEEPKVKLKLPKRPKEKR